MSIELYANNAATAVAAGGYTAGSGVLNVGSTGGNFPSVATGITQIHLMIYRVISGAITQIVNLVATNTNSGTQWAVTAEGTDANALQNDIVICVLSAAGMDQIRKDMSQFGTFANLPATTNQKQGNRYKLTDGPYDYVYTGSIWQAYHRGFNVVPPGPLSGWTGVNTGANWTQTDVGGSINLVITRNASLNWRLITKTQPATPYKRVIFMSGIAPYQASSTLGAYFYDGTKLMGIEVLVQGLTATGLSGGLVPVCTLRVEKINSVTSDNSTAASITGIGALMVSGIWLRLGNDAVNVSFDWSLDGVVWNNLFSEAIGTFITPSKYGVGGVCAATAGDLTNISFLSDAAG